MTIKDIFKCMDRKNSNFKDARGYQFNGIVLDSVLQDDDYDLTITNDDKMVILKSGKPTFTEI